MIARLWHGRTSAAKAEAYSEFLRTRAIPDYRSVSGNRAVLILRRNEDDVTHFYTFTLWESYAAIRNFAGDPLDKAKYYPEDSGFLLEFEPSVTHWEIVGSAGI